MAITLQKKVSALFESVRHSTSGLHLALIAVKRSDSEDIELRRMNKPNQNRVSFPMQPRARQTCSGDLLVKALFCHSDRGLRRRGLILQSLDAGRAKSWTRPQASVVAPTWLEGKTVQPNQRQIAISRSNAE